MRYNPDVHHRRSIRLKDYDYSKEGMYYITICTKNREKLFGEITVGVGLVSTQMKLNESGKMIKEIYENLEQEFENIKLHDYIIMPNHIHGILEIYNKEIGVDTRPTPTIGDIICSFKSKVMTRYIKGVKCGIYKPFNKTIWQRDYYEHILRNEKDYYKFCKYIQNNPFNWKDDSDYIN